MDKVSVGVIVIIMSVVMFVEGMMIIENVVCELEIVDIVNFLNVLGVKIIGQGSDCIIIEGVQCLGGGVYCVLFDCIEIGIFLVVVVIFGGKIFCCNVQLDILDVVLVKLCDVGVDIEMGEDWISFDMYGNCLKVVNVCIVLYLGFLIDMQVQFMLFNLVVEGIGVIIEMIFENCFMYILELICMGVYVEIESNIVICYGVKQFFGVQVMVIDLCVLVSLVLVGCIVEGIIIVDCIYYIDCGYECIEDKLQVLGVNI